MSAPPKTRQYELGRPQAPADVRTLSFDARDERISDTWRHVQQVAQEGFKDYDLLDLLSQTSREEAYQFPVQGWPSLLRPTSPAMMELPAVVQDKYRACQTMCFCGVFPELRRAWASIDNSLFLWRYDKEEVPQEYAADEQAISCVSLVTPKPGVFMESIRHLLLVTTTTEIHLVGLCLGSSNGDPYAQLQIQQLPQYSLPSDNIIITCSASTASGRIFLGGSDSHLYELTYAATDSWRQKRCQKVRVTGGFSQLLPTFLPTFLMGAPKALEQMVVDEERHVLYTLAAESILQVFDLGAKGTEQARKVAEVEFMEAASKAQSSISQQVFRPGGDRAGCAVKYIAPIPSRESSRLHLLAVTADGRRCYFSYNTYVPRYYNPTSMGSSSSSSHIDPAATRPQALIAVFARPAVPTAAAATGPGSRGAIAGSSAPTGSRVMTALYSDSCLLLGEVAGAGSRCCRLTAVTRAHTLPPASTNTASGSGPGYRELVGDLGQVLPGEAVALAAVPSSCSLGPEMASRLRDEMLVQLFCAPQRFVLVGTAGVLELERRRPVDVLAGLLLEGNTEKLQQFFASYGPAEAAAMCYGLATADITTTPAKLLEASLAALTSDTLVGVPTMPQDAPPGEGPGLSQANGGIYMGMAVNPNPEPLWSGAHLGLCLFLRRLMAAVWEVRCVEPLASNPALLRAALSEETMQALEAKLQSLVSFLKALAGRKKSRGQQHQAAAAAGLMAPGDGAFLGAPGGLFGAGAPAAAAAGGVDGTGLRGFGGFGTGIMQDMTGRAVNVGLGGAADGLDVPPHKKQRMWTAFQMEEQRNSAVRAVASRIAQALLLLRALCTQNITRLAARLDRSMASRLRDLTLRDLVYDNSGLATALIGALVGEALDTGGPAGAGGGRGVEELAGLLQAGAPDYFREQDKVFYQGVSQLAAAEAAAGPGERAALAADALEALLKVPQCCDLSAITARLAALHQWQGIVELALRSASMADPEHAAWRDAPSHPDTAAARAARDRCYEPLFSLVLSLLGAGDGPPPKVFPQEQQPAGQAGPPKPRDMTPAEAAAAKRALLQACTRSSDQYLHHALYSLLMGLPGGLGASELLALDPPHLEAYLRQEGGLAGITSSGLNAALSKRQVEHLQLLCRLQVQKGRYSAAAQVYRVLAERRSGSGTDAVTLSERLDEMSNALLQARSVGDEMLVEGLQASCRLLRLQQAAATNLQQQLAAADAAGGAEGAGGMRAALAELNSSCVAVSDLYNTYTQPYQMWDLCLEICDFAGNVPAEYVRQLWDLLLVATVDKALEQVAGDLGAEGTTQALEACCSRVVELGGRFYPNEGSFPLDHLALRLEQLAAGQWPQPRPAATSDPAAVVRTLRTACASASSNLLSVIAGVYEGLLKRRGAAGLAGELQIAGAAAAGAGGLLAGPLRLRLLRSLAAHCSIVLQEQLSSGAMGQAELSYGGRSRQADLLADLARRCSAEVRGEDADLAAEFDRVVQQLAAARVTGRW